MSDQIVDGEQHYFIALFYIGIHMYVHSYYMAQNLDAEFFRFNRRLLGQHFLQEIKFQHLQSVHMTDKRVLLVYASILGYIL